MQGILVSHKELQHVYGYATLDHHHKIIVHLPLYGTLWPMDVLAWHE